MSKPVDSHAGAGDSNSHREYLVAALEVESSDPVTASRLLTRVVGGDDFATWKGAAALLQRLEGVARDRAKRTVRLGVVGSYTTNQLVDLSRLAAFRYGLHLQVYEAGYDQYRQEILDPESGLYQFAPDVVLLAVHEGALDLPETSRESGDVVEAEADRWASLWQQIREVSGASVIQHNFMVPADRVHGHLARTLTGTRSSMVAALNEALARRVNPGVAIVDVEALASQIGKDRWHDARYWHIAKQAVSLEALPTLAKHTGAVLAGVMGLSRKVLVLDLDNTLWGGTIGDDGLENIVLGQGSPAGEAYMAFQEYCKALADRGVVLAVCSKNEPDTAWLPFREHPDMILTEEDIAVFVANWLPKSDNLRHIADVLGLGMDSLVLADDNPIEREAVRQLTPEVEVVELSVDPSGYADSVAGTLLFETVSLTDEDKLRSKQYKARAAAADLETTASSLEDFHRDLEMEATVAQFDDLHHPRVVQLVMKTNQFNLTTRRHNDTAIREFAADPETVTLYVKLSDRLVDHGLVSVVIAQVSEDILEIDTWVMSCRVIGRTLEHTILAHLIDAARDRGLSTIRGTYVPTDRNGLVAELYAELGFDPVGSEAGGTTWWELAVPSTTPRNEFIKEPAWTR